MREKTLDNIVKKQRQNKIDNQINKANLFAEKLLIEHMKRGIPINGITQQDIEDAKEIANMLYPIIIPEE